MSSHKDTCPDCGSLKKKGSIRCRQCSYKVMDKMRLAKICPSCGGAKAKNAILCFKCAKVKNPSVNPDLITDAWGYGFYGLFISEGTAGLNLDHRSGGSIHARLSIHLRADDRNLLVDVAEKLGGKVHDEHRSEDRNPMVVWVATNTEQVYDICQLLIKHAILPAKKLREIRLVSEFCQWRLEQPYKRVDWAYAHELRNQLLKCREFSDNGQVISA